MSFEQFMSVHWCSLLQDLALVVPPPCLAEVLPAAASQAIEIELSKAQRKCRELTLLVDELKGKLAEQHKVGVREMKKAMADADAKLVKSKASYKGKLKQYKAQKQQNAVLGDELGEIKGKMADRLVEEGKWGRE
jgi:hypothetical protein